MKKHKIIVCLAFSDEDRTQMIAKLLVRFGFSRTISDAKKIIAFSPFDVDLSSAYFVAAKSFNLKKSQITTHQLYKLAACGNLVLIGASKVPPELEFMCEIYTMSDF